MPALSFFSFSEHDYSISSLPRQNLRNVTLPTTEPSEQQARDQHEAPRSRDSPHSRTRSIIIPFAGFEPSSLTPTAKSRCASSLLSPKYYRRWPLFRRSYKPPYTMLPPNTCSLTARCSTATPPSQASPHDVSPDADPEDHSYACDLTDSVQSSPSSDTPFMHRRNLSCLKPLFFRLGYMTR